LSREVSATIDGKTINVKDRVENRGFEKQEFMLLYHINWGYPLVDVGTRVFIPSKKVRPMNATSEENAGEWMHVSDSINGCAENVFVHELRHDRQNQAYAGLYNDKLKLGVGYSFDVGALNYIVEWKSMMAGDYVYGIFPSNCHGAGRRFERDNGTLREIGPFERKQAGFILTILDGENDLRGFLSNYEACVL